MSSKINPEIFRAYDIRGIVETELTADVVKAIGQAIATEALSQNEKTIIVARDGRLSGPALLKALIDGILNAGCDVIDLGAVPTPVLYFATQIISHSATGVMLTGSHNPPNYNGLKIILKGVIQAENDLKKLYQRIIANNLKSGNGNYKKQEILPQYLHDICAKILPQEKKLKVVIDCGNGISSVIAQNIYEKLGHNIHPIFCTIDGNFPNHHPDPSNPKNLQDLITQVKKHNADIGLAFDGDADRLGVVTNDGEIIYPDKVLMLFAKEILKDNPDKKILFDVKCSQTLNQVITENHGMPIMYKTGHSWIKKKMQEDKDIILAGEMSGHFFFLNRWYGFDDGIYAGARLLEILSRTNKTAKELFAQFPKMITTPEIKVTIEEKNKFSFIENFTQACKFDDDDSLGKIIDTNKIDGVRVVYINAWGLLRASNTTPYLILRFEANTEHELKQIKNLFKEKMHAIDNSLVIDF